MNGSASTNRAAAQSVRPEDGTARLIDRLQAELEDMQAQIHLSAANLEGLHANAQHLHKTLEYMKSQQAPQARR